VHHLRLLDFPLRLLKKKRLYITLTHACFHVSDGFDKPENVLRYIKKCMTNTAGSKQSTKHSGTVPKFEKPKLPDKPFFLQNILNTDSPGDPSNFVLPNPPEKALTNLPSANKTKAPHCHGKRPVYKAFANEVLAAKIRNENRASDASRKEQMTKPNHFKTALPQVNDHREQTSSMSGLKSPYKMEHKTFAGRSLGLWLQWFLISVLFKLCFSVV